MKLIQMNDEKKFFYIKKNNESFQWKQTDGDMIFYSYQSNNFPLVINFPKKTNLNNFSKILSPNEDKNKGLMLEKEEDLKQNFNIDDFCDLLKKRKNINPIYPKNEIMDDFIKNKLKFPQELNSMESLNSNKSNKILNEINQSNNEVKNEINENESIDKLILQLPMIEDPERKAKMIKQIVFGRKKFHKEKLENFYVQISKIIKEKIEDVKEWISLEEKLMKIENLASGICKELNKYIKIQQSGKIHFDNVSSKDFLRIHFIGSMKVKINDFNLTLKSYNTLYSKKNMQNFLIKNNPYIQNYNAVFLKNNLCNRILEIFQKNKVQISEEKMNSILGIIQIANYPSLKKDISKEKEFSEALLSINVEDKNNFKNIFNNMNNNFDFNFNSKEDDYSESSYSNKKGKQLFEINNNNKKNPNQNNFLYKDSNYIINIDEANDLNYNYMKNFEPKKSKHYCVKQFSFEDFVLLKSNHQNHINDEYSHSHYSNQDIMI